MLQVNFTPFPLLETSRLCLRKTVPEDFNEVFFFRSDPEVLRYINKDPQKHPDEAKQFIAMITDNLVNNTGVSWAIALKDDPSVMIGSIALWRFIKENYRAEVGYVLHPNFQRTGIMNEALAAVCKYAFEQLGLHSIEACINPENDASRKLLIRNGFIKEGYFREDFHYNGKFYDSEVYGLLTPKGS